MTNETNSKILLKVLGTMTVAVFTALAGCAKTVDGEGSETHFVVCEADSDCAALGASSRCVAKKCTQALVTNEAAAGTGGTAGGTRGKSNSAADGDVAQGGALNRSRPPADTNPDGNGVQDGARSASHLPVDANPDGNGDAAAASICANDHRALAYTPGMSDTGPAGVTVALSSSVPAPPAVGDNDWTLLVTDSSGAVTGASITVAQLMPDHGHGGVKAVAVTEVGGGVYDASPVNFNMSGYWETTVEVKKSAVDDRVVIKLCID